MKDTSYEYPRNISKEVPIGQAYTGDLAMSASDTDECTALAMLHCGEVKVAVGYGSSEHWKRSAGCLARATSVRTQIMPWHDVPATKVPVSAREASARRTTI